MQSFDNIQEPRSDTLPRTKRPRHRPPSPLAMYQMAEYTPPPIQDPPPLARTKSLPWIIFWNCIAVLWTAGLIIWCIMVFRYGYDYSLKSSINPIRNTSAFSIFVVAFIFTALVSMVIAFASPYWFAVGLVLFSLGAIAGLGSKAVVTHYQPFDCQNMGNKFPMSVTFNSKSSPAATVHMHKSPIYDMAHESIDKWTYKTYISAEYLDWDSYLGTYVRQNNPWPYQTGVTSITTKLLPKAGADGTIRGTCGDGSACLEGKIWMRPNLEFHIKYTNPATGVTTKTTLSSDDGAWYFGKRNRPLVSLRNRNGTEVFRAQSSRTVCTAGDRNLETSLVPVGLILIAERIYKPRV